MNLTEKQKYTVLLSGKITGVKNDNLEKFRKAKEFLKTHGWNVKMPHELVGFYPDGKWGFYIEVSRDFIRDNENCILAFLDDFEDSDGAVCEKAIAQKYGRKMFMADNPDGPE